MEKLKPDELTVRINQSITLIRDGQVLDQHLQRIDKTRFWLKRVIQCQKHVEFKDVFLCSVDHRGQLFVQLKKNNH